MSALAHCDCVPLPMKGGEYFHTEECRMGRNPNPRKSAVFDEEGETVPLRCNIPAEVVEQIDQISDDEFCSRTAIVYRLLKRGLAVEREGTELGT